MGPWNSEEPRCRWSKRGLPLLQMCTSMLWLWSGRMRHVCVAKEARLSSQPACQFAPCVKAILPGAARRSRHRQPQQCACKLDPWWEDLQDLEFCRAIDIAAMGGLKALWDRGVQQDPFCQYRERAYHTLDVRIDTDSSGDLIMFVRRREHKAFEQGSTNPLVLDGTIPQERRFAEVPTEFESYAGIQDIMKQSVRAVANFEQRKGRCLSKCEIGIHMFRVHCSLNAATSPAPEGRHQDGFEYISVSVLDRCRVEGAESIVALTREGPPVLEKVFLPGQGIVFDDKFYYHDVTPILPSHGRTEGHRDVLVLTFTPE